jgi:hypothetical protein
MIFKKISPKKSAKKLPFLTQNKAKLCKILIIALVFEKNANFFAENCRKLSKIVIITLTLGRAMSCDTILLSRFNTSLKGKRRKWLLSRGMCILF